MPGKLLVIIVILIFILIGDTDRVSNRSSPLSDPKPQIKIWKLQTSI